MKLVLPLCLTISLAWGLSLAYKADISQQKGFLGRVGNKAYLVERAKYGNWTQGKSYCQGLGMMLAKIETIEELLFLNSKFEKDVFHGWHWTAARDSHRPEQFVWDDNNSSATVDLSWRTAGELETAYLSCATFSILGLNKSEMLMRNCNAVNGYYLCEI